MRERIIIIIEKYTKNKRSGNGNCSFKCLFGLKDLAGGSMDKEKQTDRDERYLTVIKVHFKSTVIPREREKGNLRKGRKKEKKMSVPSSFGELL